jgi:hypothetical protein
LQCPTVTAKADIEKLVSVLEPQSNVGVPNLRNAHVGPYAVLGVEVVQGAAEVVFILCPRYLSALSDKIVTK